MKTSLSFVLAATMLVSNSAFAMDFDEQQVAQWFAKATAGVHIASVDDALNGLTRLGAVGDCASLDVVAGQKYLLFSTSSDYHFRAIDGLSNISIPKDAVFGIEERDIGTSQHINEVVEIVDSGTAEICRFVQLPSQ